MRSSVVIFALFGLGALASPVLDTRNLPEGVAASPHSHLGAHLLRARQRSDSAVQDAWNEFVKALGVDASKPQNQAQDAWKALIRALGVNDSEPQVPAQLSASSSAGTSAQPSAGTSAQPSAGKSAQPSAGTSAQPSAGKSAQPSAGTSAQPSAGTSAQPSAGTSAQPSAGTSAQPSAGTSAQPSAGTSAQPSAQSAQADEDESCSLDESTPEPTDQAQSQTSAPPRQSSAEEGQQPKPTNEPTSIQETQTGSNMQSTQQGQGGAASANSSDVNIDILLKKFVPGLDTESVEYANLATEQHNLHRQNHSTPLLQWNDTLAGFAKSQAQGCVFQHLPTEGGAGQNLVKGAPPSEIAAAILGMYNGEIGIYEKAINGVYGKDEPDGEEFSGWGHVSQILWKDTTSFACYTATCPGGDVTFCDYYPAGKSKALHAANQTNAHTNDYIGNFGGRYAQSVLAPTGKWGTMKTTDDGLAFV
ncbi:MAG: hypothetical protein Q9163_001315 [Psora crenata]